jgi:hypothetical protein
MVRFINTIEGTINDSDLSAQIMAHLDRDDRGGAASPPVCTPCTGPCHSLNANAMWAAYCHTCPFRTEE